MTPAVEAWLPKSILLLRGYDRQKFVSDLIAGVTVGLVALPLAMAFAIASGVSPQAGLYCAIVTGFLISALGGSKTQIGGPTGAFVVVVAGIVAKHGIDGLFMCTMMAGVLLVLLGVTGMGAMVKYFPRPVIVGFTNGIAILIASTQIRDFFGLKMDHVPGDFFHRMMGAPFWSRLAQPLPSYFCICPSKQLVRGSGESPAACQNSLFRISTTTSFGSSCQQRSPWRCLAPSNRSCPRSFQTV